MPYQPVERIYCPPFVASENCSQCPNRRAVTVIGNAAVAALREMPNAEERPDYARQRKGFWITKASDTRQRAGNPEYASTMDLYESVRVQLTDMDKHCPGATVDHPLEGGAVYICHYEPSPSAPSVLPVERAAPPNEPRA